MSLVAQQSRAKSPDAHLFIASGGNAGLAAAHAAKAVGIPCTVYLPMGLSPRFLDRLKKSGAKTVVEGRDYSEAFVRCAEAAAKNENSVIVSAYDDTTLWRGHASMITETASDLKVKPDAIFCSVGGGGLLAGVVLGCKSVGWDDVPIVALETAGADCFYQSMELNRRATVPVNPPDLPTGVAVFRDLAHDVALAQLPAITSRASSLGASSPAAGTVSMALQRDGHVHCIRVPDVLSMQAGLSFAEDHKLLVELACSTTLVPAYQHALFDKIIPPRPDGKRRVVVFIVCGGAKISLEEMEEYRAILGDQSGPWQVWWDGMEILVEK